MLTLIDLQMERLVVFLPPQNTETKDIVFRCERHSKGIRNSDRPFEVKLLPLVHEVFTELC